MDKLLSALLVVIASAVVLAATARPIVGLVDAVTPLVAVVGVLILAWKLVQHYTRR